MNRIVLLFLIMCTSAFAQSEIRNFKGKIKNNVADSVFVENMMGTWRKGYALNANGSFAGRLQQGLGLFTLYYLDDELGLFLANDTDITINFNANDITNTLQFEGKGVKENRFIANMELDKAKIKQSFDKGVGEEELEQLADDMIANWKQQLKKERYNFMFKSIMNSQFGQLKGKYLVQELLGDAKMAELEGSQSPTFTYENYKGGTTSLSEFKGKYVYIDVWATWCGPCRKEIPNLKAIEEQYHDKNIVFVSISVDKQKDLAKWKLVVEKEGLDGVQLIADKDWKSDFITSYHIQSIPRFILISPKGEVLNANAPRPSEAALTQLLDKLLN
ncbi:redoxin domain-containing protein [Flavobacterium litorale]|uniref:TlpA family protein disulfide reductase n=1 Tax=Flavobacterium litorale TaxID=2856519 RepID=A0ABX8V8T9_9FLAO|nr:redoxin domain-containing protein [Flavobacterium litorale]QYJ69259.1 TlpA family protein disulfide reductase [Flavobacterium litorale]